MQCLILAVLDVQEGFNSIGGETTSFLLSTGGAATSPRYVNCVDEINSVQFAYIEGVTTKLEGMTTKLLPFFDAG